jgi:alpha-mannosidase
VDDRTGNLTRIVDLQRGQEWGGVQVARISALHEAGNDVAPSIDEQAPRIESTLDSMDAVESGPLFVRLRVHKRLCRAEVEQSITVWADTPRLDLQTSIFWWGASDLQLRLGLPSVPDATGITCGSPFYGSSWTDIVPDAAPRNRDEVRWEDYRQYKEIQGWMHLRGTHGGLTICTSHPAFHHGPAGLEAVLMRTPVSCGDSRIHWQHAGESRYSFALILGESDWRDAGSVRLGALHLHPPAARVVHAAGQGSLPAAGSFLQVGGSSALLSSLCPATVPDGAIARVYDATGRGGQVRLSGPIAQTAAVAVDFLEEHPVTLDGQGGAWHFELPAWRIQSVRLTP